MDRLQELSTRVLAERRELDTLTAQRSAILGMISQREGQIREDAEAAEVATKARVLLENLTEKKQELVRSKIEGLVTHGVQAVFGPDYAFKIEQKTARNQVTFEYRILHYFEGTVHESDLRGYHGGGLVALVGFLLRVVMVLFVHPPRRRLILLDETMAALDGDKRQSFAKLLVTLGNQLNCQFVLITHSPEYQEEADKVYEITQTSGVSTLKTIH
jgi:DNA repair exonuclease SbcCD ATPase subunit